MYIPDAVEAMIALGRNADAEPLIGELEHNGDRTGPLLDGCCRWAVPQHVAGRDGATSRRPTALRTTR